MLILYDNEIENTGVVITTFSENPDYPASTALLDDRLSRVYRSVDDTAEWIKFDLTTAQTIKYIGILGHNLTSGATVKIEGNASDSWGSPSYTKTLTIADSITESVGTQSFRWWRLTIADASNPDTYIEISKIFLGSSLVMPGMDKGQIIPIKTDSTFTLSSTRQLYGNTRIKSKSAKINFPLISEAEKTTIDAMFTHCDVTKPFILLIWENDLDVEPAIYCHLIAGLEWTRAAGVGTLWSLAFEIEEVF